jgi:hypothetical protein
MFPNGLRKCSGAFDLLLEHSLSSKIEDVFVSLALEHLLMVVWYSLKPESGYTYEFVFLAKNAVLQR